MVVHHLNMLGIQQEVWIDGTRSNQTVSFRDGTSPDPFLFTSGASAPQISVIQWS